MTGTNDRAYQAARERYAELDVDTEAAMARLQAIPISLHCWQGDDVGGFETPDAQLSGGGIQATGNYPGKARTADQLRSDLEQALRQIPGQHRVNLHAIYAELGGRPVPRNELQTAHFQGWIDWARQRGLGLDFNGSFFSHPLAASGFTLSHADAGIRRFWIEHGQVCRRIGAGMGRALGTPCVTNVWIPDGYKDIPVDRLSPRQRLAEALDQVFAEELDPAHNRDAVEAKLFGIGSESYVVGSHEFYLLYALRHGKLLCLDAGHFHPTEVISDKISSVLAFCDEVLLHVSRGVRWDSDHVVTFTDELQAIAQELVRGDFLGRTHIGLDFFDASINRVAAWVIGARNMLRALLMALLEPTRRLRVAEDAEDYTRRLALLEECKSLPFAAVWDEHCRRQDVPVGIAWLDEVERYEAEVLPRRR
ncbi:MAG: L-rhamnose isomerase [Candidatus Latescibacterota bacterium]